MAGFPGNKRGPRGYNKEPKKIGRGILESVSTDGPHNEWVGMPPYYIHTLTVDGEEYSYLNDEDKITIEIGKKVTFRYKEARNKRTIDKRSLGIVIDPSELS